MVVFLKKGMNLFLLTAAILLLTSCKKEDNESIALLYGKWRTSYSDTIEFYQRGSSDFIRYDKTLNPSAPATVDEEYTFMDNKLGIKNGYGNHGAFFFFKSFSWIARGQSFQVQGVDWFSFMSSTTTWFTFTKIP